MTTEFINKLSYVELRRQRKNHIRVYGKKIVLRCVMKKISYEAQRGSCPLCDFTDKETSEITEKKDRLNLSSRLIQNYILYFIC